VLRSNANNTKLDALADAELPSLTQAFQFYPEKPLPKPERPRAELARADPGRAEAGRAAVPQRDRPVVPEASPRAPARIDEFAAEYNPAASFPIGFLDTEGRVTAGQILSADERNLSFRGTDGKPHSAELSSIAVIFFRPFPQASREALNRDAAGLLLRRGDYVEGPLQQLRDGKVTVSSVIFGPRTFVTTDAAALVLRKPPAALDPTEK
jgi:hypothetical protein